VFAVAGEAAADTKRLLPFQRHLVHAWHGLLGAWKSGADALFLTADLSRLKRVRKQRSEQESACHAEDEQDQSFDRRHGFLANTDGAAWARRSSIRRRERAASLQQGGLHAVLISRLEIQLIGVLQDPEAVVGQPEVAGQVSHPRRKVACRPRIGGA
jgi:hypothetical protein